jgi:uncharacterized protein YbjT (DUF2867 family)
MAKILVVGATGQVGSAIALGLAASHTVFGLVRNGTENPKAGKLSGAGITVVPGDLTNANDLASACRGMDSVVTTVTSMPTNANDGLRKVDLEGTLALIEAAESASVKQFVYTSYTGNIQLDSPLQLAKRSCEHRLLHGRMNAVILRPSYFMEVWLGPHLGIDPDNGKARVCGSGENKVQYISAADVAAYGVAAVNRNETGKYIVEIGGPEALSQLAAINIIGEHAGRKMELSHIPEQVLEDQYASATDPLQKTFSALMLSCAKGDVIPDAVNNARKYGVRLTPLREVLTRTRAQVA